MWALECFVSSAYETKLVLWFIRIKIGIWISYLLVLEYGTLGERVLHVGTWPIFQLMSNNRCIIMVHVGAHYS